MKYLLMALLTLTFISCASQERIPASERTAQDGITAESYNINR